MIHHSLPSRDRADDADRVRSRRCFVSRETHERRNLLRFVYDAEQGLCWDAAEKLPGRGWWLALEKETLIAGTQRLIARQAATKKNEKQNSKNSEEREKKEDAQPDGKKGKLDGRQNAKKTAEAFLRSCALIQEQRCLSFLALARRAGAAQAGARRSVEMAQAGCLNALITTPQSSLEERRKILKAEKDESKSKGERKSKSNYELAPVCCARFSAQALGGLFAREEIVYVGIGSKKAAATGLVERLLHEIDRFEKLLRILECESTEGCEPFPRATIRERSATQSASCERTTQTHNA